MAKPPLCKTLLDHALELAGLGFHIFPLRPRSKHPPAIKAFPNRASRDPEQIRKWWTENPNYNIGISTSRFGDNEALLVVDVDVKNEKNGNDTIRKLKSEGYDFPPTFEQRTPTGGRHLIYKVPSAVKQGVNVLGPGLDIRSSGGYVVGAGSSINGKEYTVVR